MKARTGRFSSLENVVKEFRSAADYLGLNANQRSLIEDSRFSAQLKLPVRLDNSNIRVFDGYHVIHSILRGPAIGGIQFREKIDFDTVEALAFWSTHRCALLNIPFGGSCGAIACKPSSLSIGELERISRQYVTELTQLINPNNDIMTADIGTNQQIMCWLMDTYSMHVGKYSPAVALGKPIDLGGSSFAIYPTADGAYYCIQKASESIGLDIKGATIAIQGFGKAGMNIAKLLHNAGALVVAIGDISGSYYDEKGIKVEEALWHQQSNGILEGLDGELGIDKLPNSEDILELPVDILVTAAVELQITEQNMFGIKAKIIAEVAHDPVSPLADKYLYEKKTLIIPDILCNGGGSVGRYLEWVQNRTGYYWTAEKTRAELQRIIGLAFDSCMKLARERSIPLRLAAAILAVKRIAKAAELRGVYA